MNISALRAQYHERLCHEVIRTTRSEKRGDYPNFADGNSATSVAFAQGILRRMTCTEIDNKLQGQTTGRRFEIITKDFFQQAFDRLVHLRPGNWEYTTAVSLSNFQQYEHLAYIDDALSKDPKLAAAFGGNYVVRSDIVVSKSAVEDTEISKQGILDNDHSLHARLTPLRKSNQSTATNTLHAVVSCKWTIRTDRSQNTRTEVLNLIRNRKGHLPHIVAVTAEPWPTRIAALALGTGDLDRVYHFALNELIEIAQEISQSDEELLKIMVDSRRLRDISDLPFDLAI